MKEFNEAKWEKIGDWECERAPFYKRTPSVEASIGLKWVKELLKSGKVLDLGCGGGRNSKLFQDNGFTVVGVDYSESAIKLAKKLCNKCNFIVNDVLELNYENRFDLILDFGCFHHMSKKYWSKYLQMIIKGLKPNSYYLLYTYSTKSSETFNYKPGGKNWSYRRGVYNHYFSLEELKQVFNKRFKILKHKVIKETGRKLAFNLLLFQKL
jgi:cyclopropane fatty-acyl-phospholipid synthase-like methyltransferase